jgi:acyl-CoA thioesterase I
VTLKSSSDLETPSKSKVKKQARWLFVGDSLTAGFGVAPQESYVSILERELKALGYSVHLQNAGVSGDTSAGVRRRIKWLLRDRPERVFLAIGANDGLRGHPIEEMKKNIIGAVKAVQSHGVKVLLMGMKLPPNYGQDYTQRFERAFHEIAERLKVPLLPFLLEGVGGVPTLNLPDGIHPNAEGHRRVADHVLSFLKQQKIISSIPLMNE